MSKQRKNRPELTHCLCGIKKPYANCCEPYHKGQTAKDAETMMRSRYSAYALQLKAYLLETWHPKTRPVQLLADEPPIKWLGLTIIKHEKLSDSEAIVEFVARYKVGGNRAEKMHEISQFKKQSQRWFYVSGNHIMD